MEAAGENPIRLLHQLLETYELFVNFGIVVRDDRRAGHELVAVLLDEEIEELLANLV